jgi:hypothetical protein
MGGKLKSTTKSIGFQSTTGDLTANNRIEGGSFQSPSVRQPLTVVFIFQGKRMVLDGIYPDTFDATGKVGIKHPPFRTTL